jgi:hypothetical protein
MINVNQVVLAKLTRRGAFMVNEQNRELMFRFPAQKLKVDYRAGDLYEQYMWVLMKHFGHEFVLNKEAPFTDIYPTDRGCTGEQKSPEPEPENWEHA